MFDTYNLRRSAMRRYLSPLPEADAVLDQADGQHVRWQYRGLLVGEAVIPPITGAVVYISQPSNDVGAYSEPI